MTEAPVYVVFWRKRCPSGRVIRKYVSRDGGFTEHWERAWRGTLADAQQKHKILDGREEAFVVEEKRPLPAPKVGADLSGGKW